MQGCLRALGCVCSGRLCLPVATRRPRPRGAPRISSISELKAGSLGARCHGVSQLENVHTCWACSPVLGKPSLREAWLASSTTGPPGPNGLHPAVNPRASIPSSDGLLALPSHPKCLSPTFSTTSPTRVLTLAPFLPTPAAGLPPPPAPAMGRQSLRVRHRAHQRHCSGPHHGCR